MQASAIFNKALEANSTREACARIRPLLTWLSEMILQGGSELDISLQGSKRQSFDLEINKARDVLEVSDSFSSPSQLESDLMDNFRSLITGVEKNVSKFANIFSFLSYDAINRPVELSSIAGKRLLTLGLNASKAGEMIFGRIDSSSKKIIKSLKEIFLDHPDYFGDFIDSIYDSDNNIIAPEWAELFISTIDSFGKEAQDFVESLVNFLNHPSRALESDGDIEFLAKRTLRNIRTLSEPEQQHFVDMPEVLQVKQDDVDAYIGSLDFSSKDFVKQLKPLFRVHPGQLKKLIEVTEKYFNSLNKVEIDSKDSDLFKSILRVVDIVTLITLNGDNDQTNQSALNQLIGFKENFANPHDENVRLKVQELRHHLNQSLTLITEKKEIDLSQVRSNILKEGMETRSLEKALLVLGQDPTVEDVKLVGRLKALLNNKDEYVRGRFISLLALSDDDSSYEDIARIALSDSSVYVRSRALNGLSLIDVDFASPQSRAALISALSDEDSLLSTHCAKIILDDLVKDEVNLDWLKSDLRKKISPEKICDNLVYLFSCSNLVESLSAEQSQAMIFHLASASASQIDIKKVFELLSQYDQNSLLDAYVESLGNIEYKLKSNSLDVLENEQIRLVMRACFYASRNQEATLIEPLTKLLLALENDSMLKINIIHSLIELTKGPHDPKIPREYIYALSKVSMDSPKSLLELLSVNG